jgi:hypothetical protein
MQRWAQDAKTPTSTDVTESAVSLNAAAAALAVAGASPGGAFATVSNGDSVNVENSAGALDSPATAVVASGVLTGVNLASTKTILTNALKFSGVTITGSGTFFTPTIVNGVMTGGVLSAS